MPSKFDSAGKLPAGLRALVADDDAILRQLMRARLAGLVDEVVEASDGLDAWRLASSEPFDVAILDLMMPGVNGQALIQCLRGHPRTRRLPIVVVTSNEDHTSIQRALDAGASAVMTKPVSWCRLKYEIGRLLAEPEQV
ncbi:MAG: response regulator [Hyphomicrobiaceae bacterium]